MDRRGLTLVVGIATLGAGLSLQVPGGSTGPQIADVPSAPAPVRRSAVGTALQAPAGDPGVRTYTPRPGRAVGLTEEFTDALAQQLGQIRVRCLAPPGGPELHYHCDADPCAIDPFWTGAGQGIAFNSHQPRGRAVVETWQGAHTTHAVLQWHTDARGITHCDTLEPRLREVEVAVVDTDGQPAQAFVVSTEPRQWHGMTDAGGHATVQILADGPTALAAEVLGDVSEPVWVGERQHITLTLRPGPDPLDPAQVDLSEQVAQQRVREQLDGIWGVAAAHDVSVRTRLWALGYATTGEVFLLGEQLELWD